MRSSQTEKPTPGIGVLRAEQGQQPVVAAAADQRPRAHRRRRSRRPGRCSSRAAGRTPRHSGSRRPAGHGGRSRRRAPQTGPARRRAASPAPRAKAASASAALSSGTWMARKVFSAAKAVVRQAHAAQLGLLDQSPCDLFRRAAAARRQAGCLHRRCRCAPVRAARSPPTPSAATVAERRPLAADAPGRPAQPRADPAAPKARASRFCQPRGRPSAASTASNTAWSPSVTASDMPGRASASSADASATERASASAVSASPRSSMPAWKNSLPPSRRWRNTSPR